MNVYHNLEECRLRDTYLTIGVFDGVHKGHRYLFRELLETASGKNLTPLVMTFWPHPRLILNGSSEKLKYLTTLSEKIYLMESVGITNLLVLPFDERIHNMSACDFVKEILIRQLGAKGLLMGYDHRFGKNREGDYEHISACIKDMDFQVDRMDALVVDGSKISSTRIRDLLWEGKAEDAAGLLGYPFMVNGVIVGGEKLGRSLGFPTANIQLMDEHKLLPRDGVYITRIKISGKIYYGMLNIGIRPTVAEAVPKKTIEVHLFGFHGDIYGQDVQINFLKRLRNELKFPAIEALRKQLVKDREHALRWLKDQNLY